MLAHDTALLVDQSIRSVRLCDSGLALDSKFLHALTTRKFHSVKVSYSTEAEGNSRTTTGNFTFDVCQKVCRGRTIGHTAKAPFAVCQKT